MEIEKERVIGLLNRILESELAGVIRYNALFVSRLRL